MTMPLRITFHGLDRTPAIDEAIRDRADKLSQLFDRIQSCRVVVEAPHRSHKKGNLYQVKVDLIVPGEELVANRENSDDHAHEDLYVVIRDAFDAVERQLKSYVDKQSGAARRHAALR